MPKRKPNIVSLIVVGTALIIVILCAVLPDYQDTPHAYVSHVVADRGTYMADEARLYSIFGLLLSKQEGLVPPIRRSFYTNSDRHIWTEKTKKACPVI